MVDGIMEACDLDVWPMTPTPEPTPSPTTNNIVIAGPALCETWGDPHLNSFERERFDFFKFGDYVLYHGDGIEVQMRHGLPFNFPDLTGISTNHAFAFGGEWTCGIWYQYYMFYTE